MLIPCAHLSAALLLMFVAAFNIWCGYQSWWGTAHPIEPSDQHQHKEDEVLSLGGDSSVNSDESGPAISKGFEIGVVEQKPGHWETKIIGVIQGARVPEPIHPTGQLIMISNNGGRRFLGLVKRKQGVYAYYEIDNWVEDVVKKTK